MVELAHGLRRERHVQLAGRAGEPWARRIIVALLAMVVVATLLGAVGQSHDTVRAQSPAAELTVKAPTRVRGGLFAS